jgi:hypothetical protein
MSTTLDNLIEKLPPELQEVARRYEGMLGANANKDDLLAILAHALAHNFQKGYELVVRNLSNQELAELHTTANLRLRELAQSTPRAIGMPQLITEDLVGILVRFGIDALTG